MAQSLARHPNQCLCLQSLVMSRDRRQDSQMPPAASPRRSTKSNFLLPACLLNEGLRWMGRCLRQTFSSWTTTARDPRRDNWETRIACSCSRRSSNVRTKGKNCYPQPRRRDPPGWLFDGLPGPDVRGHDLGTCS